MPPPGGRVRQNRDSARCEVVGRIGLAPMSEATVPAAKQDPVLRHYELRRARVPVPGGVLSLVVPDARAWARTGAGGQAPRRNAAWEPPYWMQVWPAAVAAARAVVRLGCRGLRVLDLGCGLGVPGVAAAANGARVVFADREADALAFAQWNAVRNSVEKDAATHRVDWARETVSGSFDVIVMADVSYRPLHHEPLRRHVATCVEPDGLVVHADPWRPESTPFLDWMRGAFAVQEEDCEVVFAERRTRIRVVIAARSWSRLSEVRNAGPQRSSRQRP